MTAALASRPQTAPDPTPSWPPVLTIPAAQSADGPPPEGLSPRRTRLLVASGRSARLRHGWLADLPEILDEGDVLVVNTSAVVAAALPATAAWDADAPPLRLHWSTAEPGADPAPTRVDVRAVVELRRAAGPASVRWHGAHPGGRVRLPAGGHAVLGASLPRSDRLWHADLHLPGGARAFLGRHGQPIRYGARTPAFGLDDVQTVFARDPGSAEPPSASLAFDADLVTRLVTAGVEVAPLLLHTGVSSPEDHEPPFAEWFAVGEATAARVRAARREGRRVIAVGTTATRALESAVDAHGVVRAASGWTDLLVSPADGVRAVDGLLTGWHEPEASHLQLLEAVADRTLLADSYAEALDAGYRWHAFGDLHLLLP